MMPPYDKSTSIASPSQGPSPPPSYATSMYCAPIGSSPPAPLAGGGSPQMKDKTPSSKPPPRLNGIRKTPSKQSTPTKPISPPPPPPFPMMMMTAMTPSAGQSATAAAYHPDFMFCGSCTTCQPAEEKNTTTVSENLDDYLVHNKDDDSSSSEEEGFSSSAHHQTRLLVTRFPADSSPSLMAHGLLLQSLLQPLAGVESVVVDKTHVRVNHTLQTSQVQLVAALKRGGYTSTLENSNAQTATTAAATSETTADGQEQQQQQQQQQSIVRSQFHVGGICCAMEIPAIRKIVKPLYGVETLQINITTKMVYVQHDALLISVEAIADSLTREGFPSETVVDGAAQLQQQQSLQQLGKTGRTQLQVIGRKMDEQDADLIRELLMDVPGITQVDILVEDNIVSVQHDLEVVEGQSLPSHLPGWELEIIKTEVDSDLQILSASSLPAMSEYVESTLVVSHLQHSDIPNLQNIFRQNYSKAQVRAFFPHVPSHTIKVEHNPELLPIHDVPQLLEPHGLQAHVDVDGKEAGLMLPEVEEYGGHANGMMEEDFDTSASLKIHVVLSGLFWVLSMMSAIGGVLEYFKYFGLLSVFFGLPPVARKALRTIRRRQFDSNCMMVTAALGALALREFDEAASVAFLFSVSEFLEARSTSKARKALKAIVQLRPDHASVIHPTTKEITIVPASQVPVGSLLSIRTGDKIAADGMVVEGVSTVDESSLTGESKPIMKRKDDIVSGGTINVGTTQLVVKTTSSVQDSVVSRLIKVVEDAQSCRSKTEKMIDKFAKSYTPFVVCMAGIMCTVPWLWGAEIGRYWTLNGLIIIVIACPCSLTISTPVTYAAGLAATAQRGIIVKGGAHLEALGGVKTVVMDKTGTLTHGQFRVDNLKTIGDSYTRKEMLGLLALMEAPSSHPLSETLVRAARKEGVAIPRDADVTLHTILKGEGVTAQVNGKQVYVGNKRLFDRIGMYKDLPLADQGLATQWADNGATVGFIGVDDKGIIGAFSMVDTIRDEANETVQLLQKGGIKVVMLTGDGEGAANAVARQVGIQPSSVHSQLLPEDKLHHVGSMITPESSGCGPCKSKSKVLFIGDGINDTPALAVADVGVSMGDGAAALAMEISDVTLMDSNLSKLLYVIKMGTRTVNTIQENITFSLLSKLLVVALTFAGKMTLFGAIASDVGVMLMVTLNGMKLLPVSMDLESKAKRRIRTPRLSRYDKVDDSENDVELGYVAPNKSTKREGEETVAEVV